MKDINMCDSQLLSDTLKKIIPKDEKHFNNTFKRKYKTIYFVAQWQRTFNEKCQNQNNKFN